MVQAFGLFQSAQGERRTLLLGADRGCHRPVSGRLCLGFRRAAGGPPCGYSGENAAGLAAPVNAAWQP